MPPGPVHHARLLRRPERPADPATPPAIDPNPRRRTRPALDLPHPDRITPAPRAPGHRTRHRGPCASSTSAFAGASCPPKPNCWPTPHAPSSTSTASTNPSSGPRRSVPPTCAAYNCPAPTRAASPRPSSTGPYPLGDFSIAHVAQALSTTTAHAVYLLSQHPVDWSPPRFRRTQQTATRVGRWRIRYEQDHLSLQDIADREGTSLATVRLALLKNDVPLRPAGSYPGRPRRR